MIYDILSAAVVVAVPLTAALHHAQSGKRASRTSDSYTRKTKLQHEVDVYMSRSDWGATMDFLIAIDEIPVEELDDPWISSSPALDYLTSQDSNGRPLYPVILAPGETITPISVRTSAGSDWNAAHNEWELLLASPLLPPKPPKGALTS